MRVLVGGRVSVCQPPMLNADTNRENNPIYIALGHAFYSSHSHFYPASTIKMQNILVSTLHSGKIIYFLYLIILLTFAGKKIYRFIHCLL